MYKAEVKFYDPDQEYEDEFATMEEAVEWLRRQRRYGLCRMWLDDEPVVFENGVLVSDAIRPASEILVETLKGMRQTFHPQPKRGAAEADGVASFDMTRGVTGEEAATLVDFLTLRALESQNEYRSQEGKLPLTDEQQVRLYGRVVEPFRPRPSRGTAPQNPATLAAKGDL